MYDIESLEHQWKRYKRKKLLLPVALGAFLLVSGVVFFFWNSARHPGITEVDVVSSSRKHPVSPGAEEKKTSPSLSTEVPSMSKKPARKKGWKMTFADSETPDRNHVEAHAPSHRIDITVTKKNTKTSVSDMESRFLSDPKKEDALYLAKYYYKKKEYKKALKWALETNKLDSDIEESWLIFGKAKAKLGKRMEAIRVLQAYYDRTGSMKAKNILGKIRRGKAF